MKCIDHSKSKYNIYIIQSVTHTCAPQPFHTKLAKECFLHSVIANAASIYQLLQWTVLEYNVKKRSNFQVVARGFTTEIHPKQNYFEVTFLLMVSLCVCNKWLHINAPINNDLNNTGWVWKSYCTRMAAFFHNLPFLSCGFQLTWNMHFCGLHGLVLCFLLCEHLWKVLLYFNCILCYCYYNRYIVQLRILCSSEGCV